MKEDLISIIIPVYNVEEYLENCLNSVVNQTYKNIEIILIDDGSTDNSGKICDKYANSDQRMHVIHKENGGLSDARNVGIDIAKGKYICFIDSDDSVTNDYTDYLYNLILKYSVDLSIASYSIVTKNKKINIGYKYNECLMSQKVTLKRMLLEEGFSVSAWGKLYKTSLFDDIRFPKGKIYEDNITTYKLIMKCKNIGYGNKTIYNYYKHSNSITSKKFSNSKMSYIIFSDLMCNDILKKYDDLYIAAENKKIDSRFSVLRQMLNSNLSDEEKNIEESIIKYIFSKRKLILKSNFKKRTKIAVILLSLGKMVFKLSWNFYSKIKY